ncbi:hypothetical protein V4F39_12115 [Aquincola sp. MAHUQ-54]|uniref:Alginate export domain-containing protein n=1 Tax=Aquincola agrisoli TaxID=3119538 RepID=A0AAW9QGY6_9BURK
MPLHALRRLAAACLLALPAAALQAANDGIDAALDLADEAPAPASPAAAPVAAKPWALQIEASALDTTRRDDGRSPHSLLALDFSLDQSLARDWRGVLAWRADVSDPLADRRSTASTLKEAYVRWQPQPQALLELGRVNLRNGSAYGWNPTDFFKTQSVRSLVSAEPESLRKNRFGSVMLRGQVLWTGGSASLALSPRLAGRRPDGSLPTSDLAGRSLDDDSLARTNGSDRWLLTASHQLGERSQVQGLLFGGEGQSVQAGIDFSALVGQATTVHAEWAGGRLEPLLDRALATDGGRRFRSRAALGLTHTFPIDLSVTVEAYYNEAAPSRGQWRALGAASPSALGHALLWSWAQQEQPSREAVFVHAIWRNVVRHRLDLSGFVQADTDAGGRQYWLEARQRFDAWDLALRWQQQTGPAWTRFGAVPERRTVQLLAAFYY